MKPCSTSNMSFWFSKMG